MASLNEQVFYSDEHTTVTSAQLLLPHDADSGGNRQAFSPQSVVSVRINDFDDVAAGGCMSGLGIILIIIGVLGLFGSLVITPLALSSAFASDWPWWVGVLGIILSILLFSGVPFFLAWRIIRKKKNYSRIILGIRGQAEPVNCCRSDNEEKVQAIAEAINAARRRGGRSRRRMRGSTDS